MFGPKISRFILTTCRFHVRLRALASFNYKKYLSVGIFRNLPKLSFGRFFRKTGQCAPAPTPCMSVHSWQHVATWPGPLAGPWPVLSPVQDRRTGAIACHHQERGYYRGLHTWPCCHPYETTTTPRLGLAELRRIVLIKVFVVWKTKIR